MPLHRRRLFARRYNQSALLARELGRLMGVEVCPDALVRVRRTRVLDGHARADRFAALDGAIGPHPRKGSRLKFWVKLCTYKEWVGVNW